MFLNGILLAGAGAAVLPIVLHLWNRARGQTVAWGAMLFLGDNGRASDAKTRLRQWAILVMRVAAICLLAIGFARPVLSASRSVQPRATLALVIVIDCSPSMMHPELSTTRFKLALRVAAADLSQLRRGDQAGLIALGASGGDEPLTGDLQSVASRVAALAPGAGDANLADGIRRAGALLRSVEGASRVIHLISDRQQSAWSDLPNQPMDFRRHARVIATVVGSTENDNVSIDAIGCPGPPAVVSCPVAVTLNVHNWSDAAIRGLPLTLCEGAQVLDASRVDIAPRSTVVLDRTIKLFHAGSTVITAHIAASGMPADDAASYALDVLPAVRVLVIGHDAPRDATASTQPDRLTAEDYLRFALTPSREPAGHAAIDLTFASDSDWPDVSQTDAQVIVLADVLPGDWDQSQPLLDFVRDGGGLLLAPGANVAAAAWDSFRDDLPPPAPAIAGVTSRQSSIRFPNLSIATAFGMPIDSFVGVQVRQAYRFTATSEDTVIGRLKSGDPFMIERNFGTGHVLAIATPLDASWSNFPRSTAFVPAVQNIVRFLTGESPVRRNIAVGMPIDATIDSPRDAFVNIVRPDGRSDRIPLVMNADQGVVRYTATDLPGRYVLKARGRRDTDFIVKENPAESNLALMTDTKIDSLLKNATVERSATPLALIARPEPRVPDEFAPSFIALAAACLLMDMAMANRTSRAAGAA